MSRQLFFFERPSRFVAGTGTITQDGPGSKSQAESAADPKDDEGYKAALERQRQREYEAEKLACSLENKEACLMCSG